jgi:serine/threonine-protein kinase RsbW
MSGHSSVSSFEAWVKRLRIDPSELEEMLQRLHMHEFVNWDGRNIQSGTGPQIWKDYLKIRYQLDVENKPRALVMARTLTDALKRAPDTMNRHHKQSRLVNLGKLVSHFNYQQVPAILFDYAGFSRKYKGEELESVSAGLETETLLSLPQTVHSASCAAFKKEMRELCDEKLCFVAHTFEEGTRYSDAQEVVWLVGYIDEKEAVPVAADEARKWCERFKALVGELDFGRHQLWLISNSGFTDEALAVLNEEQYKAFSSNHQQFELLSARLGMPVNTGVHNSEANEFRLEMPIGGDNELIAAGTIELIAGRLPFRPDAINQIKMAVIEACINVFEHSFSPDQKISQRFRLESDKLVVTISSRGVVPTNLNGASSRSDTTEAAEARRGYGLILIRSLMDEVEFERVDDGTSLRMTKYLRDTAS